jgi:hypothetical protein
MVRELSLDVFRETLWNHEVLRLDSLDFGRSSIDAVEIGQYGG